MAVTITRTAWTDDDGTGTSGTVINNAAKTQLYDQIDTAIAALPVNGTSLTAHGVVVGNGTSAVNVTSAGTAGYVLTSNGASADPTFQASGSFTAVEQTTSNTGAQADFAKSAGNIVYIRCTGAAPVFSGFTGGAAGAIIVLECLGTTLKVTNQDTGSSAANRIITAATQGQIVGAGGRILLQYDNTTGRWRAAVIDPGAWITVPYASGNFTGSGSMTWTVSSGNQKNFKYRQAGKSVEFQIAIESTTVGGTPSSALQVTLPFTITTGTNAGLGYPAITRDNGGSLELVNIFLTSGSATLAFWRTGGNNWSASTALTFVTWMGALEVD